MTLVFTRGRDGGSRAVRLHEQPDDLECRDLHAEVRLRVEVREGRDSVMREILERRVDAGDRAAHVTDMQRVYAVSTLAIWCRSTVAANKLPCGIARDNCPAGLRARQGRATRRSSSAASTAMRAERATSGMPAPGCTLPEAAYRP